MQGIRRLAQIGSALVITAGCLLQGAGTASAATTYHVQGTNGTLAIQSQPAVNHVVGWLANGAAVQVACQINNGGADPYDGLTSRTWDELTSGNWVYDWYISTPPQGSDGFSPGVPHCGGPAQLTTSIAVPNLPIGGIQAYGYTAGPIYNDGPGFTNANRAETLAAAEGSGFCQDLVMANTDFSWLWPDINYVARWPGDAINNGRSVTSYPIVGAVVVFRPGNHYFNSTYYWNYGDGHVAMVVKVDSASYTVAEFNFNLGGGGRYIMDFRRIPWPDPYPTWGDGASVAGFIR
jgi:CHAP domain